MARIAIKCAVCRVTIATCSRDALARAIKSFAWVLRNLTTPESLVSDVEERADILCPQCATNRANTSQSQDNAK